MWQYNYTPESDELYHHGILGMKWGVRRYQNKDGSLTAAGRKRYAKETYENEKKQAHDRHQTSLKKLASSGRGNDTNAVLKTAKQLDDDLAAAKAKYKAEKKTIRLTNKLEKNIDKQTKADNKVLNARAKSRSKLEAKYDDALAATNNPDTRKTLLNTKKAVLDDFDLVTEFVKTAQKVGRENKNTILELKIQAVSDPTIKQSETYKVAKKWCEAQARSEAIYGESGTLLLETSAVARGEEWTRSKIK